MHEVSRTPGLDSGSGVDCDLLLEGGLVVDGTGAAARAASVAIRGDRIVAVGACAGVRAAHRVDVQGLHVCPGFIDTHAHDDQLLFDDAAMTPKVSQGVTTVVVGNCGVSLAPLVRDDVPPPLTEMGRVFRFGTFAEFLNGLREQPPALNAACLVGHTTLRVNAMPDLSRRATPREIDAMQALCQDAMAAGAIGLSSGVFYPPARAADWSEVAAVAEPVGEAGGIYATHLRDEADGILAAIDEACRVARHARVPLVVSHHKVMGRANFGRSTETLAYLDEVARRQPVSFDVYPYTAGASMLSEGLHAASARTIVTWSGPYPQAAGRDLVDVAREFGLSERDALNALLPAGAIYFLMDEGDVTRILAHPSAMIGSDGVPSEHPHPRLWGTFPRVLGHYCRDLKLFTFEEAVHRMTGLPAGRFGLAGRGRIEAGAFADLAIVDAQHVADVATYETPALPSQGIRAVYVNGRCVWQGSRSTEARPGRVLSRPSTVAEPAH
jgi:N-acyl-D-amino-acid deacylase